MHSTRCSLPKSILHVSARGRGVLWLHRLAAEIFVGRSPSGRQSPQPAFQVTTPSFPHALSASVSCAALTNCNATTDGGNPDAALGGSTFGHYERRPEIEVGFLAELYGRVFLISSLVGGFYPFVLGAEAPWPPFFATLKRERTTRMTRFQALNLNSKHQQRSSTRRGYDSRVGL